ncbi:MAG TPA: hypothetical protein VNV85_13445 [Puia sp.]|jgi:outer membrane protein assembly factor BamA|nr:hypothetical protein [Puia sp.]
MIPFFVFPQSKTKSIHADTVVKTDMIGILKGWLHIDFNKGPERPGKKVYYSFLPVSSQVPGAGITLVTSTTAGFFLGDRENTSLSTITFSPYFTLKGSFGYTFRSNLWLNTDKWEIMGDTRYLYYPQYTWGLGGSPDDENKISINYKYVRFYQTLLRRIRPYFLAGLGYHADWHFDIDTINDTLGLAKFTGYPYGTKANQNSFSSGLSVNVLYDSRRNEFNPFPGYYGHIVYRFNPPFLGSTEIWHSLYIDFRRYISFSYTEQNMIAFWSYYWTALSSRAPFLDLPSIGWDPYQQRSGRGFPQNRYRGNGLLYFETEYRRDITRDGLLGFVLFTNINSVTEPVTNQYAYIHLAAGCGLRLKFNKRTNTNISLDYGISREYSAVYLNLGETF